MKKAPSTILATAGITVGLLGVALPASAATTAPSPHHPITFPTGPATYPTKPVTYPTKPVTYPTKPVTYPTKPVTYPTKPGYPGKQGHPGKPVYKPKPKPTPTCHPQPKPPVKPIGYNKGSNKYKEYTAAVYSWEHPKSGHTVKCDPKPVKHPVKHPAPPKHHHAPKKHWWQGWFN
jgi:hypothetical protein